MKIGLGASSISLLLVIIGLSVSSNYVGPAIDPATNTLVVTYRIGTRDLTLDCDDASCNAPHVDNMWTMNVDNCQNTNQELCDAQATMQSTSIAAFSFFFVGMLFNCGQITQCALENVEGSVLAKAVSAAGNLCYLLAVILAVNGSNDFRGYLSSRPSPDPKVNDWTW